MCDVMREMPRYKCHKEVHALQIAMVDIDEAPGATITPTEQGYAPFRVDQEYVDKHKPEAGGYYIVYSDGYKSFSPTGAFEEGYTAV